MSGRDFVQELYVGFYSRPADPDGLQYWLNRFDSGEENKASAVETFAVSEEAQEYVYQDPKTGKSYANDELVNNIYLNLFGRDAETEGLEYYAAKLDQGEMTTVSIVQNVMDGAQDGETPDATILNNKLEVASYFTENAQGKTYGENHLDEAREVLAGEILDVSEAKSVADEVLADLPREAKELVQGEFDYTLEIIPESQSVSVTMETVLPEGTDLPLSAQWKLQVMNYSVTNIIHAIFTCPLACFFYSEIADKREGKSVWKKDVTRPLMHASVPFCPFP